MMDVTIEHIGLDSAIGVVNVIQQIDGTKSWDEIKKTIVNSIGDDLKDPLFLCEPIIKIIDTDGCEYILNVSFIRKKQPFRTNGDNSVSKKLKVIWRRVTNTRPTQSIVKDASTQTDEGITDSHQYAQPQAMDQSVSLLIDWDEEIFKDAQLQPELTEIEKDEFNQYINNSNNGTKIDQTEISNNVSIDVLLKAFKDHPSTIFLSQQNNLMPMPGSSEQVLNPTNDHDNDSAENQSQSSSKRPNQSEGDTNPKKRKKRIIKRDSSSNRLPTEIICGHISTNGEIKFDKQPYDQSIVPVISNFVLDKMIHFTHDIDQIKRERYLSESKKMPRIQRKKEDGDKSKDSILPVLELPPDYQRRILADDLVLMGFACVTECQNLTINGEEEIEFCLVGYKKFKYYSDENEQILPMFVVYPLNENDTVEQLIFQITSTSDGNNEYMLIAHPFKVKDQFKIEIGPVMFRLSAEYIQAARENGFKFGEKGLAHRYAAYLFKYDEQSNQYIPDFETLGLSDYIFYHSKKKQ